MKLFNVIKLPNIIIIKLSNIFVPWFTEEVARENQFVEPNFKLGQFFFDKRTAVVLVDVLDTYQNPCCLCTPRLAQEWMDRGRIVRLLDIDRRFQYLPGYRFYNFKRPTTLHEEFDVIICDPPRFSAAKLKISVDILTKNIQDQALFILFPVSRESKLLHAFSDYNLQPTEFPIAHNNVKKEHAHLFKLYGNRPLKSPESS
ncbi:MAG: protein-lysine N-methyltransferase [Candidatus Bipolaricaulia bacterium]